MSASGYNFKLKTQPPTPEEQKLFGIFVSHASENDPLVDELCAKAEGTPIHLLHDGNFIHVGHDFNKQIRKFIRCYGCVVIVTKDSLVSDWVQYECGYFSQSGHPVVLWDPENLLSLKPQEKKEDAKDEKKKKGLLGRFRSQEDAKTPEEAAREEALASAAATALLNFHLTQYLPVCHTADEVIAQLQHLSVYADLYTDACEGYSVQDFQEDLRQNVTTTMVYLKSNMLNRKTDLFKECKISTLVVNFGMYYEKQGDGIHCWAKRTLNTTDGTFTADDKCLLPDGKCKHSGGKCTMYSPGGIDRNMKQCVTLNHIIPSGRYFDITDKDYSDKPLDEGMLAFYVPVHKIYGTEFKFIVDAPSQAKHAELMQLFEDMGMNPTVSDSLNGWRIYLSLPDVPYQGFFRLEHLFHNNFLCPRAAASTKER